MVHPSNLSLLNDIDNALREVQKELKEIEHRSDDTRQLQKECRAALLKKKFEIGKFEPVSHHSRPHNSFDTNNDELIVHKHKIKIEISPPPSPKVRGRLQHDERDKHIPRSRSRPQTHTKQSKPSKPYRPTPIVKYPPQKDLVVTISSQRPSYLPIFPTKSILLRSSHSPLRELPTDIPSPPPLKPRSLPQTSRAPILRAPPETLDPPPPAFEDEDKLFPAVAPMYNGGFNSHMPFMNLMAQVMSGLARRDSGVSTAGDEGFGNQFNAQDAKPARHAPSPTEVTKELTTCAIQTEAEMASIAIQMNPPIDKSIQMTPRPSASSPSHPRTATHVVTSVVSPPLVRILFQRPIYGQRRQRVSSPPPASSKSPSLPLHASPAVSPLRPTSPPPFDSVSPSTASITSSTHDSVLHASLKTVLRQWLSATVPHAVAPLSTVHEDERSVAESLIRPLLETSVASPPLHLNSMSLLSPPRSGRSPAPHAPISVTSASLRTPSLIPQEPPRTLRTVSSARHTLLPDVPVPSPAGSQPLPSRFAEPNWFAKTNDALDRAQRILQWQKPEQRLESSGSSPLASLLSFESVSSEDPRRGFFVRTGAGGQGLNLSEGEIESSINLSNFSFETGQAPLDEADASGILSSLESGMVLDPIAMNGVNSNARMMMMFNSDGEISAMSSLQSFRGAR